MSNFVIIDEGLYVKKYLNLESIVYAVYDQYSGISLYTNESKNPEYTVTSQKAIDRILEYLDSNLYNEEKGGTGL